MMIWYLDGPSPEEPPDLSERLFQIEQFWEQLDMSNSGTPGETTWEELERLKSQVFAALAATPKDVTRAESLTAYAALLMTGFNCL
jgi:hypothetical protein